jgi:hypothetical protein
LWSTSNSTPHSLEINALTKVSTSSASVDFAEITDFTRRQPALVEIKIGRTPDQIEAIPRPLSAGPQERLMAECAKLTENALTVEVIRPGKPLALIGSTRAKQAVAEVERGPYNRMNEAHDAIRKWMAANRRESAGHSWEIYGDPTPDPADTETTVGYLLK